MTNKNNIRPVMLVIMDGVGWRKEVEGNAFLLANTPNLDRYRAEYPFALLSASGEDVGLPEGQMGNSEVGHLNLGAGRIVYQELTRINKAIRDGDFFGNQTLIETFEKVKAGSGTLHLMGLVSDGGVHSSMEHLYAIIRMAHKHNVPRILIHAFLDGRDTLPTSGAGYIKALVEECGVIGAGSVVTVCGRFYAMDRDKRWERVEHAYKALVRAEAVEFSDPVQAIQASYQQGETDEFVKPVIITTPYEKGASRIKNGDGVVFFNFRADRARELVRAFKEDDFSFFDVSDRPKLSVFSTLTRYDETFTLPVAFPPQSLNKILGQVVAEMGIKQLRIAETEKYAHVTYFFSGGEEKPFDGEDRCLIPSPREVATYDLKPEMSAFQVADELEKRINEGNYGLIVVNFANGDMVGHTGVMEAAIKACEAVDTCVGRVVEAWRAKGGATLITADHGNCEVMLAPDGSPATAHTTSPVPLFLVDDKRKGATLHNGILADIASTILQLMGISQPDEMTGKHLVD